MATEKDYATNPIPMSERRSPFTMGLLWITMVTYFPTVLIGFEWFKNGFTLPQVLTCTGLSCLMLLAYQIPATLLGAKSGLSYTAMSRGVFGRWGSRLISFNIFWMFACFYALFAYLLAESLKGLFHWQTPLIWLAAGFAMLMSCNNFFGFKGVANFARFFAAPLLIGWVGFTLYKALSHCPPDLLTQPEHKTFAVALTSISGFVIGIAVWGNEKDYWRFGKPKMINSAIPLAVALLIGQILFPAAGWIVAKTTGITECGAATAFMNNYSFGGMVWLCALVLAASYFACNDSNMYGALAGLANLKTLPHKVWSLIFGLGSAFTAAALTALGGDASINWITSLNCVFMPAPTVIMLGEWFLIAHVFKTHAIKDTRVPSFEELPSVRWPALVALLASLFVGVLTSGVIPGTEKFNVGIASVQAWITALVVYIPLRLNEYKRQSVGERRGLEKALDLTPVEVDKDLVR